MYSNVVTSALMSYSIDILEKHRHRDRGEAASEVWLRWKCLDGESWVSTYFKLDSAYFRGEGSRWTSLGCSSSSTLETLYCSSNRVTEHSSRDYRVTHPGSTTGAKVCCGFHKAGTESDQ